MRRGGTRHEAPTRREYAKYGVTIGGGGLLAGCTDGSGAGRPSSAAGAGTTTGPADGTSAAGERSWSVTMSPVGEVEFDAVPRTVFARLTHHAGMLLALGRGDAINALHAGGYYDVVWTRFLERLDGVSVDWADLSSSTSFDKETLYELDSDLHLVDPASVLAMEGWSESDVEEVASGIAPWFGNKFSADHTEPPAPYAGDYRYYTVWEIFARVAEVLREEARYEALASIRSDLLTTIAEGLPPDGERPSVAMVLFSPSDDDMWGYPLNGPGFYSAHTRPLGATGAFEAAGLAVGDSARIDAETLLEADPDVVLALASMSEGKDLGDVREHLESDPVMGKVTAVRDGRVHPQGARWQGPVLNLFQLEMTAKQLYPEPFGEWPTYVDGPYPEIPEDERLFDRGHVADVINGSP